MLTPDTVARRDESALQSVADYRSGAAAEVAIRGR
jgi:hypothetical protein